MRGQTHRGDTQKRSNNEQRAKSGNREIRRRPAVTGDIQTGESRSKGRTGRAGRVAKGASGQGW